MPRAETRDTMRAGALEFRIHRNPGQLRVSLAGILDREGMAALMRRVTLALWGRGRLVILDGSRLDHLDYRCVAPLVRWSRGLAGYGHRVELVGWNPYLKAILAMEDWDGELRGAAWRVGGTAGRAVQP